MATDKPSLLDKIRQRQVPTPAPAKPPAPEPEAPTATVKSAKKAKPSGQTITFACGHARPLAKLIGKPCRTCQEYELAGVRRARNQRIRAKREAQRQPETADTSGRLPDGASFEVHYHAEMMTWAGSLLVPGLPPFSGSAGGVFRLLGELDAQYRAAVAEF